MMDNAMPQEREDPDETERWERERDVESDAQEYEDEVETENWEKDKANQLDEPFGGGSTEEAS